VFPGLLVCVSCLGADPAAAGTVGTQSKATHLTLYQEAKTRMGRGADAQVRMALWCEAHGLDSERLKHLTIAVLTEPAHATARGLLGLVAYHGQWRSPQAVDDLLAADQTMRAALAEYNGRRARMGNSADSHWKIALWCQQHGLKPEAAAHLAIVTQLDPRREAAWKRLGYKKQGGRWATPEALAAENVEIEAQKKADKHWSTLLAKLRSRHDEGSKQADVNDALGRISDPRAVPSVVAIFAAGKASHQEIAAQLLGQIDSPGSTRALGLLALAGKSSEVRSKATQTLRHRSVRQIASSTVVLLRDPELDPDPILYHYNLHPAGWDGIGSLGVLFVQGPNYDVLKTYPLPEQTTLRDPSGFVPSAPSWGYERRVVQQRQQQSNDLAAIISQILSDSAGGVLAAKAHVRQVEQLNARIIQVLAATTGRNLGQDREAWRKWWAEEQGYTYQPPPSTPRQDLALGDYKPTFVSEVRLDCFAAGTPVHALTGLRPIEQIKVGDQVLTQDPVSGALSYQPVLATVCSQPAELLNISLSQESIKATGIDRFWKVGQGWVMARELRPGDLLRSLGRVSPVKSVESAGSEPVFNLRVMRAQSFFVGQRGTLVHDSSLVETVHQPFDAVPDLPVNLVQFGNQTEHP
jgi:hypothetical protein